MRKLIYIVASPTSMQGFILPRIDWLKKEYEVVCICSPGPEHEEAQTQGCTLHGPRWHHKNSKGYNIKHQHFYLLNNTH